MNHVYRVDDVIRVRVSDTKPYAAFVVAENGQKGLLHISEISDNYIKDIEKIIEKGDEINVIILEIDINDGFLRVSYKKVPEEKKFSTHKNNRKLPETQNDDFKPLEDHLEEWIQNIVKKIEESKK